MVDEENSNSQTKNEVVKEIKTFAVITWLIIPVTIFFPWDVKSSDSGGSAFAIGILGLLVFLIFSIILAKTASTNRYIISDGLRRFAYSPLVFASFMVLVVLYVIVF